MKPLTSSSRQARIQQETELELLFRQQHEFRRCSYPEMATYDGDHRFDDRLTDLSDEASGRRCEKNREFLLELDQLQPELMSPTARINYNLFRQLLNEEIRHHELGWHLLGIDQQEGMHLRFPQLVEIQPLRSYEQYEQYFSRLSSFEKQVEDTIGNLNLGIQRGLVLPRSVVLQSLVQMDELAASAPDQMPLYEPIRRHLPELPESLQEKVADMALRLISGSVLPAYARLAEYVREVYLPACRNTDGLCGLSNGAELYQYWIDRHTCPGLDPESIHQQGLAEVARLHGELKPIQQRLGLTGSLRQVHEQLNADASCFYTDVETMMQDYGIMLDQAQALLPRLFRNLPVSRCELKEIEAWRAAAAPQAYYYPPPQDLSRPGYFYVNTYDLPARPRYGMMALTLHEAVPGHHLQLARALEMKQVPDFRYHLECTAFVEGWALYAEALGHPLGLYDDPLQALGALSFELWRASRLVVDTGLHAFGWTREQAVEYFREHTLQSESDIQSEIDRYLSLPGQALAYKIGELKIWSLRNEAESKLGERFDLRDFHELLLEQGSIPISLLEARFRDWLAAAQTDAPRADV